MAEALAVAGSVAGLISLADATVRALKSVCNVISRIKHSSAEIRKVHSELRAIERLISEIQAYCRDCETTSLFGTRLEALKENLNSCQKEFETLRLIFKQPLTPPVNAFSRFGKKMKFVYNEHAISQSCLNLGRQQQMIVVSLSILGRLAPCKFGFLATAKMTYYYIVGTILTCEKQLTVWINTSYISNAKRPISRPHYNPNSMLQMQKYMAP